ncbi:MAG: glycosyltransferase family 4 protein [Deltaproteobacteria bacterium]|nr:glycosyltransferase family 4 protein [Deltaproteobacteria bacterium]
MNVLMIGFDQTTLATARGKPGDTRERHIRYAEALRKYHPSGQIRVLLRVPGSWSSRAVELGEGITVHPVPCQRWAFATTAMRAIRPVVTGKHFDLVTTQTPFDDGLLGVWLKHSFGIPLNVQMRSSFLDLPFWIQERPFAYRIFNLLGKWVAQRADTIRTVSEGEKHRLLKRFPVLHERIFTLHPLVNFKLFSEPLTEEERSQAQSRLQQYGLIGKPFVLFVGRFVTQKNLATLFQAFAVIRQQIPETALVMAGDGPLRSDLERLTRRLDLSRTVVWLGNLSLNALRGWYALAKATVLPSLHEGFGKVIMESYLVGTPVVVTPFVSAAELVQDGKTGFVTQSFNDCHELANKLRILLSSPALSAEMGRNGKLYAQRYLLNEEVYLKRLIEIWKQTASRRTTNY